MIQEYDRVLKKKKQKQKKRYRTHTKKGEN